MGTQPLTTRDRNRVAVMATLLDSPTMTRIEIAERTGVSAPSVSRIVRELVSEGLLLEGAFTEREGAGRRSQYVELSSTVGSVAGFDLGIYRSRAVCSSLSGEVLSQWEADTPATSSADELAQWIVDGVRATAENVLALVVSLPTRVVDGRVVADATSEFAHLSGTALFDALDARCGFPVHLTSDSAAALLNELDRGVAQDVQDAVLLTVSQTTTAAIALDRKLRHGWNGAAGAVRRLPVGPDGASVDSAISLTAVTRELDRLGRTVDGWAELISAERRSPEIARVRADFVTGITGVTAALAGSVDPQMVIYDGRMVPLIASALDEISGGLAELLPASPQLRTASDAQLYASAIGAGILAAELARADLLATLPGLRTKD